MNKFIVDLVNFLKKMLDLRLGLRLDLRLELLREMVDSRVEVGIVISTKIISSFIKINHCVSCVRCVSNTTVTPEQERKYALQHSAIS